MYAKFLHSFFTFWWQKTSSVTIWMTRSKKGWNIVTARQDWSKYRLIRKKLRLAQIHSTKIAVRKADRNRGKNSSLNVPQTVVNWKVSVTRLNQSYFQGAEDMHPNNYFKRWKKKDFSNLSLWIAVKYSERNL